MPHGILESDIDLSCVTCLAAQDGPSSAAIDAHRLNDMLDSEMPHDSIDGAGSYLVLGHMR